MIHRPNADVKQIDLNLPSSSLEIMSVRQPMLVSVVTTARFVPNHGPLTLPLPTHGTRIHTATADANRRKPLSHLHHSMRKYSNMVTSAQAEGKTNPFARMAAHVTCLGH